MDILDRYDHHSTQRYRAWRYWTLLYVEAFDLSAKSTKDYTKHLLS